MLTNYIDSKDDLNILYLQISSTSVLADGKKTGDCLTDTLSVSNPGGNSPPGDLLVVVVVGMVPSFLIEFSFWCEYDNIMTKMA